MSSSVTSTCNLSEIATKIQNIKNHMKSYPDFPKKGVLFWDIFSVLKQPAIFAELRDVLVHFSKIIQPPVECIAALDARGFLFGPLVALELQVPFVPIRKKGKLPGKTEAVTYSLEYGQDVVEIQAESIKKGQKVLIIDDLLATGGTLEAGCQLVKKVGGDVAGCLVVLEIPELNGRKRVSAEIKSLICI